MSGLPPIQPPSGFSNYPRTGGSPSGGLYTRPPGIYFDYILTAWQIIQADLGNWVLMSFLTGIVTQVISVPFTFLGNFIAYGDLLGMSRVGFDLGKYLLATAIGLIGAFAAYPIHTGMMMAGLKAVRGERVTPGDLFSAYPRFLHVIPAYFLMFLGTTLGSIFFLLPGIYLAGALSFSQLLVVDRKMSCLEALRTSFNTLKSLGSGLGMFALIFVALLASCLGLLACGIGVVFTAPIYSIVIALTYNNYFPPQTAASGYHAIGMEPPR